jgi:hypothetical protein
MHPLFALRPGERIGLPGVTELVPTYLSTSRNADLLLRVPWPGGDARIPFPIDLVQSAKARFAGKFFATGHVNTARLGGPREWLAMSWRGLPSIGVWMTYGAWPTFNDVTNVAIEPTTSPNDRLSEAIDRGRALTLAPLGSVAWNVSILLKTQ